MKISMIVKLRRLPIAGVPLADNHFITPALQAITFSNDLFQDICNVMNTNIKHELVL